MDNLTFLGLLCTLLACTPKDTPSKPPTTSKNEPTTIPKLPAPPLTLTKQKWQQDKEWGGQKSDEFPPKGKNQPWADVPFDKSALIEVKRSDALLTLGKAQTQKIYTSLIKMMTVFLWQNCPHAT